MEEEKLVVEETETTSDDTQEKTEEQPQDILKQELEKVSGKKSELEKAIYKQKQIEKRIEELTGHKKEEELSDEDDDKPLTIGQFKKLQQKEATHSALQLADDIEEEYERELVKHYLSNGIKTGDPKQDLAIARAYVNSKKNTMVIEESQRQKTAKSFSKGNSAPAKTEEPDIELTANEQYFLRAKKSDGTPLMTIEDIKKARKG